MRFLGAGETARMDVRRRDDILSLISAGREIEAAAILHPRVIMSSPEAPVDPRMMALAAATKTFDSHDPVVRAIDSRLRSNPGPSWRDLSAQESVALSAWAKAADQMGQQVQQSVPAAAGNTGVIVLMLLAVGAILAPVLFAGGEGTPDTGLPFRFGAPPLHPSFSPTGQEREGRSAGLFPSEERRPSFAYGRDGGRPRFRGGIPRRSEIVSAQDEE